MRFVPVKSAERQAALMDHKTREFLVRLQTALDHATKRAETSCATGGNHRRGSVSLRRARQAA